MLGYVFLSYCSEHVGFLLYHIVASLFRVKSEETGIGFHAAELTWCEQAWCVWRDLSRVHGCSWEPGEHFVLGPKCLSLLLHLDSRWSDCIHGFQSVTSMLEIFRCVLLVQSLSWASFLFQSIATWMSPWQHAQKWTCDFYLPRCGHTWVHLPPLPYPLTLNKWLHLVLSSW